MNKFGKAVLFMSAASVALALMLILTVPALAEVVGGDPNAIINEDLDDDLFIGGDVVEINSTINGDVFAAGRNVIINGHIKGNLIITGQYLRLNGTVDGSVIAGGMEFQVEDGSRVGGSLYFGGFSLLVDEGSEIGRSVYMGGYQTEIAGYVRQNSITSGASYILSGRVGGDVHVELDVSDPGSSDDFQFWSFMDNRYTLTFNNPGLFIDEDAIVGGEIHPKVTSLDIEIPEVEGIIINNPELVSRVGDDFSFQPDFSSSFGYQLLDRIRKMIGETIGLTLVGLVFIFWKRDLLDKVSDALDSKLLPSFGWGLIVLVLSPFIFLFVLFVLVVVGLLLSLVTLGTLTGEFVTIASSSFMLASGFFGLAVWYLSKIVVSYWVGRKLVNAILPKVKDNKWGYFWSIFFGVVIYGLIRAIPILGAILAFFVIVFGMGAIFILVRKQLTKPKKAKA